MWNDLPTLRYLISDYLVMMILKLVMVFNRKPLNVFQTITLKQGLKIAIM